MTTLEKNAQSLLDRLIKYKQDPVIISLKDINVKFFWGKKFSPSKESLRKAMKMLEDRGAIKWERGTVNRGTVSNKNVIHILRETI